MSYQLSGKVGGIASVVKTFKGHFCSPRHISLNECGRFILNFFRNFHLDDLSNTEDYQAPQHYTHNDYVGVKISVS